MGGEWHRQAGRQVVAGYWAMAHQNADRIVHSPSHSNPSRWLYTFRPALYAEMGILEMAARHVRRRVCRRLNKLWLPRQRCRSCKECKFTCSDARCADGSPNSVPFMSVDGSRVASCTVVGECWCPRVMWPFVCHTLLLHSALCK